MKHCKNCNQTYNNNQNFCQTCGDALVIAPETTSKISQVDGNKCCTKCNITYDFDKKFCEKCGNHLTDITKEISKLDAQIIEYEEKLKTNQLDVNLLTEYAQLLFDNSKYKEANSLLLRIETIDEKNLFAKNLLFVSYQKLKQYNDAIAVGEELLLIEENNISLVLQLAEISSNLFSKLKEKEFYDKALAIDPDNFVALGKRATSLLNKNLIIDAIPLYEKLHTLGQTQKLTIIYAGIGKILNNDFQSGISLLDYKILNEDGVHISRGYLFLSYALCQTNADLYDIEHLSFAKIRFHVLAISPNVLDEEFAAKTILYIVSQKTNKIDHPENSSINIDKIINQYLISEEAFFKKISKPILAESWFVIGLKQKEFGLFSDAEYSFNKAFDLNQDEKKYKEKLDEVLLINNKANKKSNIKKGILITTVLIAIISAIVSVNISKRNTENKAWETAKTNNTADSYNEYLTIYPEGNYKIKADSLREELLWINAIHSNIIEYYDIYLTIYPKGKYASKSKEFIEEILWKKTIKEGYVSSYRKYIKRFPDGKHSKIANDFLDENLWKVTISQNTLSSFATYQENYPNGIHISEAKLMIENLPDQSSAETTEQSSSSSASVSLPSWLQGSHWVLRNDYGIVCEVKFGYGKYLNFRMLDSSFMSCEYAIPNNLNCIFFKYNGVDIELWINKDNYTIETKTGQAFSTY